MKNPANVEIHRKDGSLLISSTCHRIHSGKPLHRRRERIFHRRQEITLHHRRQETILHRHREFTLHHRRQDCLTHLSQDRNLHPNGRGGSCRDSARILIHETSGTTADQYGTM
jgi:hypothetical protein